jgi:ATP-binding cassette subfamily B protein
MTNAASICWPASRALEGVALLARVSGLPVRQSQRQEGIAYGGSLDVDMPRAAAAAGLDVEAIDASYPEVGSLLRSAAPAIVRMPDETFVLLAGSRRRKARVIADDHRITWVSIDVLREALTERAAAPVVAESARLADEIGLGAARRAHVVRGLVAERLRSHHVQAGWLLRLPPGAGFGSQLIAAGARRQFIALAAAHAAQYLLWIAAWWLLGRAALLGRLDSAWLIAWALALFTLAPLQLAAMWLQGSLALGAGALLKQRLLAGAFRLQPEEVRRDGVGQLMGRVIEAEAVESLALGGGLLAALAVMELALAAGVLWLAAPLLSLLLVVWTAITTVLAAAYFGRRRDWVRLRIGLTHDLIERMLGHRTRLAQQPRDRWHEGEDEIVERYVRASASMDRTAIVLLGLVPRGWMLVGLCGLAPLFVGAESAAALAIGLGGILLGFRAMDRLTAGLLSLAGAAIAWRQTSPVFRAAAAMPGDAAPPDRRTAEGKRTGAAALDASDIRFTHAGRPEPVLRGCSLTVAPGERIILQGPSGGGKSTFAAILAGLRAPQSGLLLLDGLDRHTLGSSGWRRRVVLVPQFHENHLLLGSVALNTLMGINWPPGEQDFARAEAVLRELGLGPVLDRMPSGVLQTIGETGWQLSHGERSRLFLARALLQQPDVLVLDESFAQLDPANMQLALDAVVRRAPAVVLIAHP